MPSDAVATVALASRRPLVQVWACPDHLDGLTGPREFGRRRRTGRAMRRAKAYIKGNVGQGQLSDMVMITERPA